MSISFLAGYKTYVLVGLAALVFIGQLLGIESASVANSLYTVFGFGGILGLRSAIAASAPKQP